MGVSKRLTLAADFVGQHYFNAALLTTPQDTSAIVDNQQVSFSSIAAALVRTISMRWLWAISI